MILGDVSVMIDQPISTEFVNTWGSTNADDFASFEIATVERLSNSETMTVTFTGLNYGDNDPLEIRIYGVLGEDDGVFGIRLDVTTIVPVPEPSSTLALLCSSILFLRRRR